MSDQPVILSIKAARKKARKSLNVEYEEKKIKLEPISDVEKSSKKKKKSKRKANDPLVDTSESGNEMSPSKRPSLSKSPNSSSLELQEYKDCLSHEELLGMGDATPNPGKLSKKKSKKKHKEFSSVINNELLTLASQAEDRLQDDGLSSASEFESLSQKNPTPKSPQKKTAQPAVRQIHRMSSEESDIASPQPLSCALLSNSERTATPVTLARKKTTNHEMTTANSPSTPRTLARRAKFLRYSAPTGFKRVHLDSGAPDAEDTEVWLLKVPPQFNFEQLRGVTGIPDVASMTIARGKSTKASDHQFQQEEDSDRWEMDIKSTPASQMEGVSVLLATSDKRFIPAGPIQGIMSARRCCSILPAVPPEVPASRRVLMPTGLKLRHVPFGSDAPSLRYGYSEIKKAKKSKKKKKEAEDHVDAIDLAQWGLLSASAETEKPKKKKKKNKEK